MASTWLTPWIGAATGIVLALAGPVWAGPPFVTDDPEPTDLGHWEIYNFVSASQAPGVTSGQTGFDINYGGAKDLQLTATVPADFATGTGAGFGDLELAAKYRFLHQAEGSIMPDVAVFPRLIAPTASRGFGPTRLNLFLPIWAQKDFGPWSVFAGGGYQINPGPGQRDFWQSGLVVSRMLTDRWSVGGELYHQTAEDRGGAAFTGINLGAIYKLTDHWALLAASGPGVQNPREGGQFDLYVALEATY